MDEGTLDSLNFPRGRRQGSMKFLVVLESMRVVVLMMIFLMPCS